MIITLLSIGWSITLIVIGLIAIVVLWFVGTMNKMREYSLKVQEAESGIDVALTKRYDTLTKLLETTKGYAKHETETLEKIVKWRNGIPDNATLKDKAEFLGQLDSVANGLSVVVEKYPDLKADAVFKELQLAITNTEEHLQAARRMYNANVTRLNTMVITFPQNIVANSIHMEKQVYFEAEEKKRKDVDIKF